MEEQEIDLRDYINVLIKRKWIVITVFLISVITTGIVSFLMPKAYETGAIIENGFIEGEVIKKADSRDIITSTEILKKVIEKAKIDMPIYKFRRLVEVEDIEKTSYTRVKTKGKTPGNARELCEILVSSYLDYGNKLYKEREDLLKEKLAKTTEQIEKVKIGITRIEETIDRFSSSGVSISPEEMSKIILLQNILANSVGQLTSLNNREGSLRSILINAKPFRIIDSPIEPEYPIRPKKKLNIAISAILSLIIGTFLAFFIEYWQRVD